MKLYLLLVTCFACYFSGYTQLIADEGSSITIGNNASLYVAGNVTSFVSVKGAGTLVMNGTATQTLLMSGNAVSHLRINNDNDVVLSFGSLTVDSSLSFVSGKLKIANNDLIFSSAAGITGAGPSSFIWTGGSGKVRKNLTSDMSEFLLPLGESNNYRPAYLTGAGNNYTNGSVTVQLKNGVVPNTPPMIANRIAAYWSVARSGIAGGTLTIKGQYNPTDVVGSENTLRGYYFNGTDWSSQNETHDIGLHQVSATVTNSAGVLTAMNKFVAVGARAFLQGPYSAAAGLMNDDLRTGTSVIPLSDPYRATPYNAFFTHINNSVTEAAPNSVFTTKFPGNKNIVDWVFLELRSTAVSPGNTVLTTRSALIQRDGDIVDIDGVSPVTFNSVPDGNYILAVRHRNHLGLSLDPATGSKTFSEKSSTAFTANVADFRLTSTPLFGAANSYASASHPTLGTARMLWAGNASMNGNTKYTGLQNDKDAILINALGNNSATVLSNVYSPADLNLNRVVRFNGLFNDKDYLYISILGSSTTTQRLQALPN